MTLLLWEVYHVSPLGYILCQKKKKTLAFVIIGQHKIYLTEGKVGKNKCTWSLISWGQISKKQLTTHTHFTGCKY